MSDELDDYQQEKSRAWNTANARADRILELERDIADVREQLAGQERSSLRMGRILEGVCSVVKGPYPDHTLPSWHDLASATSNKIRDEVQKAEQEMERKFAASLHVSEGTPQDIIHAAVCFLDGTVERARILRHVIKQGERVDEAVREMDALRADRHLDDQLLACARKHTRSRDEAAFKVGWESARKHIKDADCQCCTGCDLAARDKLAHEAGARWEAIDGGDAVLT